MTDNRFSSDEQSPDQGLPLEQVRRELDQSCRALDGATVSRLNAIRHRALEQRFSPRRPAFLLPFGGLATACVLVVAVMLLEPGLRPMPERAVDDTPIEDIDLLTSADSLELFMDYEFYQWLAENN